MVTIKRIESAQRFALPIKCYKEYYISDILYILAYCVHYMYLCTFKYPIIA